ncbi:MAG: ABC transporter ATP-binding protein [Treponema sp.]|nr:ABC transporter ATP-binding protein [Treponema sp.]
MPRPGPQEQKGYAKPQHTRNTLRRLFAYMLVHKALWVVVFMAVGISAAASVASSYIIKPALNDYIIPFVGKQHVDLSGFIKMLMLTFAIFAAGSLASWVNARLTLHIATDVLYKLRVDVFAKLETLPIKYYDAHPHGEIMSRFTNDIDTLRDMLSQSMPQLLSSLITVASIFVMMLVLSPVLTAVVVVSIALIMLLAVKIGKLSAASFREQQKNLGTVNGYIEELIEGQRVVKVFNYEDESIEKFAEINNNLRVAGTRANTYASILMPLLGNLSHVQYALVAILGSLFVIRGSLDIGTIAAFLQYTRNFSRPITMMSQQFNGVLNALAGAERIFAIIDENAEIDEGTIRLVNAYEAADKTAQSNKRLVQSYASTGEWAWKNPAETTLIKLRGEVVFDNVTFGYVSEKTVLHNICIHAKPAQKIAFVGSTGSGKTTIINLLTRFYDIAEGAITYDGIPINAIKKDDLRRSLGMVLQDTHLFTGTIRDNIRYGNLEASAVQIEDAARLANADSFISHLEDGYDTVISGDGGNLSQGQRQLLAIARAAVADPPVLVLDEATSSIDTRTEALIQKGMDSLMQGRTVFVIAHRLSTVRNADEIIVLEKGTIIERGTHDELLAKKGRYARLYTGNALT